MHSSFTVGLFRKRAHSLPLVFPPLILGCVFFLSCLAVFPHPEISISDDQSTLIVNDAPDQEIIALGKSVIINKQAKGVLAVGGDITIEGRVDGDVAAFGGDVIQKKEAYVGGDIIVVGGEYKPEVDTPLRVDGKQTVMVAMFEEELRSLGQDPSQIFWPSFSFGFVAQRLVLALFWFIISIVMTTVAPGAVGRAVARIHLTTLRVAAVGAGAFLLIMAMIIGGAITLSNYLGATLGVMGIVVLVLGYVFGRVALHVSAGKLVQKYLLSEGSRSETLATLIGVMAWTLLLSLPYIWMIAVFAAFIFGIGLILTGRAQPKWQTP